MLIVVVDMRRSSAAEFAGDCIMLGWPMFGWPMLGWPMFDCSTNSWC